MIDRLSISYWRLSMCPRVLAFTFSVFTLLAFNFLVFNVAHASELQVQKEPKVQELNFRVLLDGREIGFHRFRVEQTADTQTIDVDANFKVTLLAIPFYRYTHNNREVWRNGCLESIRSRTDDNGDQFSVDGIRSVSSFNINALNPKGTSYNVDDDCVMTFAYWNSDFLKQQQLLNSQNGEWLPVDIDFIGVEDIKLGDSFGNRAVVAKRYQVRNLASEIDITVWYDDTTGRWLSLESRVSGGRLIRYLPVANKGA